MVFEGFGSNGLDMLRGLGAHDKDWFAAHRADYTAWLATPAKAFAEAMIEALRDDVSPGLDGQPKVNGSISPINNDLRFAPDKAPYKDHYLFKWWEGPNKKTAPTLWVRMHPDEVGFATGVVFAPAGLDRWRSAVADEESGPLLATAVEALVDATGAEVVGAELKRVPKPFATDHPRADLLRHKWLQIRWREPVPPEIGSPAFVDWCSDRLAGATAVHRWLVDHL
ncbi:MAG: DUF2461 domain-containing protein [Acidimicrobiia bacterium]|nr:DUF2461 domain-containing protein [Acidimicrobiia bacterium]